MHCYPNLYRNFDRLVAINATIGRSCALNSSKKSLDAKHKGFNRFTKAEDETRDLIKFLWASSTGNVSATIYIKLSYPQVLE